jgi:hypothetical protein
MGYEMSAWVKNYAMLVGRNVNLCKHPDRNLCAKTVYLGSYASVIATLGTFAGVGDDCGGFGDSVAGS